MNGWNFSGPWQYLNFSPTRAHLFVICRTDHSSPNHLAILLNYDSFITASSPKTQLLPKKFSKEAWVTCCSHGGCWANPTFREFIKGHWLQCHPGLFQKTVPSCTTFSFLGTAQSLKVNLQLIEYWLYRCAGSAQPVTKWGWIRAKEKSHYNVPLLPLSKGK